MSYNFLKGLFEDLKNNRSRTVVIIVLAVIFAGLTWFISGYLNELGKNTASNKKANIHKENNTSSIEIGDTKLQNNSLLYKGIPYEEYRKVVEEYGITKSSLGNFFKILDQQECELENLDFTLRSIAKTYKQFEKKINEKSIDNDVIKI